MKGSAKPPFDTQIPLCLEYKAALLACSPLVRRLYGAFWLPGKRLREHSTLLFFLSISLSNTRRNTGKVQTHQQGWHYVIGCCHQFSITEKRIKQQSPLGICSLLSRSHVLLPLISPPFFSFSSPPFMTSKRAFARTATDISLRPPLTQTFADPDEIAEDNDDNFNDLGAGGIGGASRGRLMPDPVHAVPYLTPHKVSVLILIEFFCRNQCPPDAAQQLLLFLLDCIQVPCMDLTRLCGHDIRQLIIGHIPHHPFALLIHRILQSTCIAM